MSKNESAESATFGAAGGLLWTGRVGAGAFLLAALIGCGGGGGGGGGAVVPVVTPAPNATSGSSSRPTPLASSNTLVAAACTQEVDIQDATRRTLALPTSSPHVTKFSFQSNPSGLPVTLNGQSAGVTPISATPAPGDAAYVAQIGNGPSASYCFSQTGGADRTVLYNSVTDTSGSIGSVSTSSYAVAAGARRAASASVAPPRVRHAVPGAPAPQIDATKLLVKYRAATLASSGRTILGVERGVAARGARTLGPQSGGLISRVTTLAPGTDIEAARRALLADPAVASASYVHKRYAMAATVLPDDPRFAENDLNQWDLYQISAPAGWGVTTGAASVAIAVIDTGYDVTAPDLRGKVTYSESVIDGTVDQSANAAKDTEGHGTNVSGIAAAATDNGIAVAGVGYNVSLQSYRIFPNGASGGGATTTDEAQAIYDAVAHGAKVISLSLGGTQGSGTIYGGIDAAEFDAVQYAIAHDVAVVAASGNERSDSVTSVDYPAAYDGVIAVGASALDDSKNPRSRTLATEYVASYSNSGPGLALVAPGGDPSSTQDDDPLHWILNLDTSTPADPANQCSVPAACIAQFAGTSQATPHVSGAAALMLSLNPSLTPKQIRTILMNTADDINDARQGAGRLNLYRALAAVSGASVDTAPAYRNFRAIAYTNSGGSTPAIVDATYLSGVPVASDGTFRVSDVPASVGNYRIAVWADVNGDGVVDAGDYIGTSDACTPTAPCTGVTRMQIGRVPTGYALP